MKTATYTIPAHNLYLAEAKISKINARAEKLGLAPFTMTVSDPIFDMVNHTLREWNEITITGEYPVINGWRIIGTINHDADYHLISTYGNYDLVRYRTMKPVCEHCGQHKITVISYLVENVESGEILAVGKGCLKNYMDADPKTMLAYLEWFSSFATEIEEEFMGGSFTSMFDVKQVLKVASLAIRNWGFTKSSETDSTASTVAEWFHDIKFSNEYPVSERDTVIADAVIEEFNKPAGDSEFNFLIQSLIARKGVEAKWFAHLAGAVFGYTRKLEQKAKTKSYTSGYVGALKKRMEATLTLESVKTINGYYGSTFIHSFVDDAGHALTWFASESAGDITDRGVDVGKPFTAKFTPKSFSVNDYTNADTTTINRVAITSK